MSERIRYFPHLDALRFFAAVTVVVYHVIRLKPWDDFPFTTFPLHWFNYGWMAVDVFFVLSGFVILLSAMQELERSENVGEARRHFLLRRAARIMPLYFVTLFADLILRQPEFIHHPDFWYHLGLHLVMLHNWSVAAHDSIDGPNWSVAFEMQFYLLVWALMPWLARIRWQVLAVLIFAVAIGWRYAVWELSVAKGYDVGWKFVYAVQVPGMIDQLGGGMLLAKLLYQYPHYFASSWKRGGALVVLAVLMLIASFFWMWPDRMHYYDASRLVIFFRSLLAVCFTLLVAGFVLLPPAKNRLVLRLERFAGNISYGVYLWHMIFLWLMVKYGVQEDLVFVFLLLAISIAISSVTFYLVEKPAMDWAHKRRGARYAKF